MLEEEENRGRPAGKKRSSVEAERKKSKRQSTQRNREEEAGRKSGRAKRKYVKKPRRDVLCHAVDRLRDTTTERKQASSL